MITPRFYGIVPTGRTDSSASLVRSLGILWRDRRAIWGNLVVIRPDSLICPSIRADMVNNSRSVRSHIAAIRAWDRAKAKEVAK